MIDSSIDKMPQSFDNLLHMDNLSKISISKDSISYRGFLSSSLSGLLEDYLDAENLQALDCRSRIADWATLNRVPITEWVAALALIKCKYPRPALGLYIGRCAKLHHGGMMGYLWLSSDNLGEVIERISRFNDLVWGGINVPITRSADQITIRWTMPEGMSSQSSLAQLSQETGLAILISVIRLLTDSSVNPVAVAIAGIKPEHPELYEQFFHCPVTFGAEVLSISFATSTLNQPIRMSSKIMQDYVERLTVAKPDTLKQSDSFLATLHSVLLSALHDGESTIVHVAQRMNLSRTTLQRRMEERGLSFREFLDKTRLELAQMYLADHRLSLTEITWMLAFSEQSAFSRSFKKWTGQSPLAYRQSLQRKL